MALVDTTWYVNFGNGTSTGYYAVTQWAVATSIAAGARRRQLAAPAVGNERVFVCIVAGTTHATTEPTWVLTRGAKTTDGTVTWMECSGQAALNGDLTNTVTWAQVKAATPAVLGQIIKRSNNASYQICTTAGAMSASEPAFSDTAGVTTTDTTAVWTSLGAVSNFTGGQAPHARLANALASTWFASGNTVYVGDNHAETQSTSLNLAGSSALMARILCHAASGSYPPTALTTGAVLTTTATAPIAFTLQGSFYFYGLIFSGATAGSSGAYITMQPTSVGQVHNWYYFDHCSFRIGTTGVNGNMIFSTGGASSWSTFILDNTTMKFLATSQFLVVQSCQFLWRNTGQILESGSSVPAILFKPSGTNLSTVMLEGLDLSQLTGSLFDNVTPNIAVIGTLSVKDCKLNASTTVTPPLNTGMQIQLAASDSGATSYKSSRYTYEATETTETSIVRTGGYIDPAGQAQSRKIVTTANTQWLRPYQAQPLSVWNAATGSSKTVTVYGTVNSGSLPNNDDIWLEVNGLTNASFPVGSTVTSGKANVWSANAAVTSDSSTWTGLSMTTIDGTPTAGIALSNGNLTVTHSGSSSNQWVYSTAFLTGGKYYFEATLTTYASSNIIDVGIILVGTSYVAGNTVLFRTGSSITRIFSDGGVDTGKNLGATAQGDVFGLAVDLDTRLIWIRKGGGNWNVDAAANPATGVGGITVVAGFFAPFIRFGNITTGDVFTFNFGQSSYVNAAPSGFGNWSGWDGGRFKLIATLTPNMAGYLIPQVKVARASTTYYIDPLAVVT